MSEQVKEVIRKTVIQMLDGSVSPINIRRMARKHEEKPHFIPIRYRIVGGILQGLNIKLGNFIEQLLSNIVELDTGVRAMEDSGRKILLSFTPQTDALIDSYITRRQLPNSPDDCTQQFEDLLQNILKIESAVPDSERGGIVKDVDGLFQTADGLIVYTELKYNDDHDTGKFVDINRKFIKTWAGLAVRYQIESTDQLLPILYYFNPRKRYGPIYVPSKNIMRGSQLFERFFHINYKDVDRYLKEVGDDPEILAIFDRIYDLIRNQDLP
ncbi:MAG: restriction endonuclease [Anaerolineae bacterium]|nr:restriction endonuclease [Anaerolineae bacterium]MCI0610966.1 restriction endonuclease [Anaerolineae bacterium]